MLQYAIRYCTAAQTDPENTDYAVEHGAYRTFQAERLAELEEERVQQEKEEEEANNPMLVSASLVASSQDFQSTHRDINPEYEASPDIDLVSTQERMTHLSVSHLQALENRTKESRREMDVLDALEEIRDWNTRNAQG